MKAYAGTLHVARTQTRGGRDRGLARSDDGVLDVRLARPNSGRIGTNPEQLLAAAWSASLTSSLASAASARGLKLPADSKIDAQVALQFDENGCYLCVRFYVDLGGIDPGVAQVLIDEAHRICPYSRATEGNVEVTTRLT